MTRPLHVKTDVQRGDRPTGEQRERGYEPRDASPGKVMLAAACFVGLMVLGLGFAAATLGWLEGQDERPRDTSNAMAVAPLQPHLLAEPRTAKRRYDAAINRRMDDTALARARRDLVRHGWREAEPAPGPQETARAHRGAAQ